MALTASIRSKATIKSSFKILVGYDFCQNRFTSGPFQIRTVPEFTHKNQKNHHNSSKSKYFERMGLKFTASGILLGSGIWMSFKTAKADQESNEKDFLKAPKRPELPSYTKAEVAKHSTPETGIWVTYQNGVYDVTEFLAGHPGGDNILLAAGGSVEPFWAMYAQHKTPETMEILEELRIGNLDPKESLGTIQIDTSDPFALEPKRHPALQPRSLKPFNADVPPDLLVDSFITPTELFYVRNHLPVPKPIEISKYKLKLDGIGLKEKEFTLQDLKMKFENVKMTSAIQCAGNRRSEMDRVKHVQGLPWGFTAISNAEWTGVRLRDVLIACGVNPDDPRYEHVQFEGLDVDPSGKPYGASISLEKAMNNECMLAFEINGKPLTMDHGYPLRVIVPGVIGARQVKWLKKITLSDKESPSHWQQKDYRVFSPSADFSTVDYSSAPAIQDAPVTSAICQPTHRSKIQRGSTYVDVKGYAYSGGGRGIIRVDVSADGGRTWYPATLQQAPEQRWHRMWAWTLWNVRLPLPADAPGGSKIEIAAKATNLAYNTQPEHPDAVWNFRGLLNNSWHRIELLVG